MHLKEKSLLNADAADRLIKSKLYAPSIHCSYYSCFQLSVHKLKESGIDYEVQEENAKKAVNDEGISLGTHNYTIKETASKISDGISYRRDMDQLKRLRKKSDYKNTTITDLEASKAYGHMQNVLSVLTDY